MTPKTLWLLMVSYMEPKATLEDLALLIKCQGNYEVMETTKLFQDHHKEYCKYIEILEEYK